MNENRNSTSSKTLLTNGRVIMNKLIKFSIAAAAVALLSGCTGSVYNKEKNCDYDYLLHPAVSISKIIGGCGPVEK
jgi:1-aminocyclopropane-1-carboxylate deaminase/D-cysteine desulfhydrase-like pyridoxal-dependent ACC family enzyme